MTAPVFVDTNVFVYARQLREPLKQPVAMQWIEQLWEDQLGRTSMQVISETYVTLTRKIKPALDPEQAWGYVLPLLEWAPQPLDTDLIERAHEVERRYRISWWDSLIVGAAQLQNCAVLLTEDLQDHAVYGGVTVRNPFTLAVSDIPALYGGAPQVTPRYRSRGRPKRAMTR